MVLETMKNIHPIYNIKVDEERVVCVCEDVQRNFLRIFIEERQI